MMCAQNDVLMVSVHCVLDMIEDMPPVVLAEDLQLTKPILFRCSYCMTCLCIVLNKDAPNLSISLQGLRQQVLLLGVSPYLC